MINEAVKVWKLSTNTNISSSLNVSNYFGTPCKLREILVPLQLMYHVPGWYLFLVEKPKGEGGGN